MRTAMFRRCMIVCLGLALGCVLLTQLAACHTVKGLGRDVEAMAQGGQDIIDGK